MINQSQSLDCAVPNNPRNIQSTFIGKTNFVKLFENKIISVLETFYEQYKISYFSIFKFWNLRNKYSDIGKHDLNRRNKLILEIGLSKGVPVSFSPTRPIIFFLNADWLER